MLLEMPGGRSSAFSNGIFVHHQTNRECPPARASCRGMSSCSRSSAATENRWSLSSLSDIT